MTTATRQPDIKLVLRRPAEPDGEADRRLRAALKRLLRDYGLKVVSLGVEPPTDAAPQPTEATGEGY